MSEIIRVLIADNHTMVRNGLMMFLKSYPDIELVGEAANGHEAVTLCGSLQPDVVLMDLVMPEMDGVAATRAIVQAYPKIRVIALTSFNEDQLIYAALKAGIVAYLLKDCTADELVNTIRDAYAGKTTITPEIMQAVLRVADNPATRQYHLSERERDVLRLVVRGFSNRQIAANLTLSESTIKFHVSNILSKLGIATRAEAVALAIQHKLVE
ncbi:MAG: response regulator transcription factor [Chloroflexota bacterium]|nr:response regulator transcription factor [Anaerolineae bacterium]